MNMKNKHIALLMLTVLLTISCKKDDGAVSCEANSGSFEIEVNGNQRILQIDSETNYTLVYNWFGYQESALVIYGKDQHGKTLNVEMTIPGIINEGTHTYSSDLYFQLTLDTVNVTADEATFNVLESEYSSSDGTYKPIRADFSGSGEESYWSGGQQVEVPRTFSGSFCLNGLIM